MYSDVFCRVYDSFGWNYYPEVFCTQLLTWLEERQLQPRTAMDLACGTGVLCAGLRSAGIRADGMDLSEGMLEIARKNDPMGHYTAADMVTFCPDTRYELVTCTGDALNHIPALADVGQIFRNVYRYLERGGCFVFDLLDRQEISTSEPFEAELEDGRQIWFQMTQPTPSSVNLCIRVYSAGRLEMEENIREVLHDPEDVCELLEAAGFTILKCGHTLPDSAAEPGTTWFIAAQKV